MRQPGFEKMTGLAHGDKAYVTTPLSAGPQVFVRFAPLARILIAANVDCILRDTH